MLKSVCLMLLLTMPAASGCGNGTLVFGGNTGGGTQNVTVTGDVEDILPPNPTRDVVVFVFTNLRDPGTYRDFDDGEAVVLGASSSTFTIDGVASGDLTIVFLLDDTQPDGEINAGDPTALLEDPNARLQNIRQGQNIDLRKINIDFNTGVADADDIVVTSGGGSS